MKQVDGWWWPDGERHMLDWIANPKNRLILWGRPAYQGKKQLRCLDFLPANRRRTMIDVGGHIGLWSFNFARYFQRIEAFEPVAAHRDCFQANVLDDRVFLHPYALGEREGMISMYTNPSSSGDSWIKGKGTVPMKTIDGFGFEDVDFIKVDCEGYEEFVLRGAIETIKRCMPFVIVEQKRDMAMKFDLKSLGAVTFLNSLGYKTVDELGGDYLMMPR